MGTKKHMSISAILAAQKGMFVHLCPCVIRDPFRDLKYNYPIIPLLYRALMVVVEPILILTFRVATKM